ncbi:unnamed protein product [Ectocarpus sp. CCAP 1310/34]|nr:unnamed protein product [Ectocarpus sp. CCAP 1310/34]
MIKFARILFDAGANLEGNGVEGGGNGGGLWNEGFVKFGQEATFTLNVVEGSGGGGGMFNQGGLVRFEGNSTLNQNEAFDGSAFVNSAGGRVAVRQEMSITDNVSQEEASSVAGAVWNQADSVVFCTAMMSWEGNSGYQAGALLNAGRMVFRGEVSVRDNTAVMDGGGFINESGGRILFFHGAEFLSNVGTGSGGAILNHAELDFAPGGDDSSSSRSTDDDSSDESTTRTFTLDFQDNYCGEQECQDIQNKDGSSILGLHQYVPDLCDIGTQDIVAT